MAAEAEAKRRGADDAVFVDGDGIVLEGPTTNIWWRRDRTLFTPSLDLGILAGVTRAAVLELAGDSATRSRRAHYGLTELAGADEAFTSSSVREVMPVDRARRRADRARPGRRRAPGRARRAAEATLRA